MAKDVHLVTGAAGFIGFHLVQKLLGKQQRIIAVDNFSNQLPGLDLKNIRWEKLSSDLIIKKKVDLVSEPLEFLNDFQISNVYNLAALPGFLNNWSNIHPYIESNVYLVSKLLEYFRERPLKNFIHASTSSVYGKHAIGGEEQDLNPISPYGVSKLAAEKLLLAYSDNFGLPVKILRYFSVYGPMQRPDMAFAKLINCIKFGKAFNLYGDGTQKRSNTYVEDIVNATLMAESCSSGQVLNICGDDHVSLNQVIQIIETITNSKIQIVGNDPRNGDQEDTFGDNSKAKSILKWSPKTGIREGLKLQIESVL